MNNRYAILLLTTCFTGSLGVCADAKNPPVNAAPKAAPVQNAAEETTKEEVNPQTELYLTTQPYVVSIEIRTTEAAYSSPGTSFGTGSILDKDKGIILTNAHVAIPDGVNDHYDITLHDGSVTKAQLIYSDPWHDFALLKTDPKGLASIPQSLPTQRKAAAMGEPVLIIGKNENKHFSIQTGTVATPYETSDVLPSETFRISLNAQGGASGSPVINTSGKAIGIVYASNGVTSAFALPIDYALDAMEAVLAGKIPSRFGTGAIFQLTSLEDLVRYDSLNADTVKAYVKKFPKAFNRILTVKSTLLGSPAHDVLLPGDVLIAVNNIEMNASLYQLDLMLNTAKDQKKAKAAFKIIRHGKEMTLSVPTYNLHDHTITRMLSFGKAVFYEINDEITQRTGASRGVFVTNMKPGGSFHDVLPAIAGKNGSSKALVSIVNVDGHPIKTLDDLKKLLPNLIKKNHFYITIRNFGVEPIYNNEYAFSQAEQIKYASYYAADGAPEMYSFDKDEKTWKVTVVS